MATLALGWLLVELFHEPSRALYEEPSSPPNVLQQAYLQEELEGTWISRIRLEDSILIFDKQEPPLDLEYDDMILRKFPNGYLYTHVNQVGCLVGEPSVDSSDWRESNDTIIIALKQGGWTEEIRENVNQYSKEPLADGSFQLRLIKRIVDKKYSNTGSTAN